MAQFIKYAVIGAFATLINVSVAEFCAYFVWPCVDSSLIEPALRATRAVYCNLAGFVIANIVCYLLNRRFVFEPGRHKAIIEFALFFLGSAFAILCGSAAIWLLIRAFDFSTHYSFIVNVLVSVLVNYVVRKFFVFKG